MVILVVFNQLWCSEKNVHSHQKYTIFINHTLKCNTPLKNMRVLKKKFSEAMKEIIKAYLLIYQNTCSTSESSKKVLYGIFIVYAITCIKLRSDAALSKLKPKAGLLACL